MRLNPRDRLILALDVASVDAAYKMVERLGDSVGIYKIGYQLAYAGGFALAEELAGRGKKVFLDLKLHDIANTVEEGVRSVARTSEKGLSPIPGTLSSPTVDPSNTGEFANLETPQEVCDGLE